MNVPPLHERHKHVNILLLTKKACEKMSVSDVRARFEAFSKSTLLDVFLPRSSDSDAASLVRDGKADNIARAPGRRNLFFGNVFMIFARSPTY